MNGLLISSLHLSLIHLFYPSFNPNPTHDRNPNTSPPKQHTTSLPRLSNGGSIVAETLWEWSGSQGATLVIWNTVLVGYHDLPDGTCSIFLQPFLATLWDGSMVLICLVLDRMIVKIFEK